MILKEPVLRMLSKSRHARTRCAHHSLLFFLWKHNIFNFTCWKLWTFQITYSECYKETLKHVIGSDLSTARVQPLFLKIICDAEVLQDEGQMILELMESGPPGGIAKMCVPL